MRLCLLVLVFLCVGQNAVYSQNVEKPSIYYLHIQSDIKFRFATTLVTSKVVNPSNESQEVKFDVILPDEAFISDFLMEIGGVVYPGQVDEKKKAEKKYQSAKKKGQSAGQVKQKPRQTNKFSVEVNVAAGERVTFNLTYQELLYRSQGRYEHVIYINPGQIVDDFRIDVSIEESREITNIYVPPLRSDITDDKSLNSSHDFAIIEERPTPKTARISFNPSKEDQRKRSEEGIAGLFVVEYDIERERGAGDVLVVNGYFVHFFAPSGMPPIPKDILFILDISGSMYGKKMKQLSDAMLQILSDLQEGDRFNIMKFNQKVSYWKTGKVVNVNRESIQMAKNYVARMTAQGYTNINDAMVMGVDFLKSLDDNEGRTAVLLFLTDGQPSSGVQDINKILSNVKDINTVEIPVFSLAFGRNADYEFVKKVAVQNNGFGRRIYEDSDANLQIAGFYNEVSATTLQNLTFTYLEDEGPVENLTKSSFRSYFDGSELVIAGKVDEGVTLELKIHAEGANGSIQLEQPKTSELTGPKDLQDITEKIWAYTTIKQLLEQSIGETDATLKQEMKDQALALSLKYRFVTPLTSMVVTKPDEENVGDLEEGDDADLLNKDKPAVPPSRGLYQPPPQRLAGGGAGYDPHFVMRVDGMYHPICFDVYAKPGSVLRLLSDKNTGLTVNAGIIPSFRRGSHHMKTFIGEVVVLFHNLTIVAQPTRYIVNGKQMSWEDEVPVHLSEVEIRVTRPRYRERLLHVNIGGDVVLLIRRVSASSKMAADYLNVYLQKDNGLSVVSDGIIGQFVQRKIEMAAVRINKNEEAVGWLKVNDKDGVTNVRVVLDERRDTLTGKLEYCWDVHRHVKGLLSKSKYRFFIDDIMST